MPCLLGVRMCFDVETSLACSGKSRRDRLYECFDPVVSVFLIAPFKSSTSNGFDHLKRSPAMSTEVRTGSRTHIVALCVEGLPLQP